MYRELLIGCGQRLEKQFGTTAHPTWENLTTLDINPDHRPDVLHDLNILPLPFEANSFDEIHALDVLEHVGSQGDYKTFFAQFSEFWRILKPGGLFFIQVPLPSSCWAWGDPSHTRVLPKECFYFLSQSFYGQVGQTPCSDFRYIYKADLEMIGAAVAGEAQRIVLRANKNGD